MMRENETIQNLQKDIVIPEVVRMKSEWAFEQIKEESRRKNNVYQGKMKWKAFRVAVAAAVLAIGTVTVSAAAYIHWAKGLEGQFHATEEQKQYLEDLQISAPHTESVTSGGVTVSVQQSIVDNWFAYLSFKIEGYDLPEGCEPGFEDIDVSVDGNGSYSWTGSFYDGLTWDENGHSVYVDPAMAERMNGTIQEIYAAEDGSLEFEMMLYGHHDPGCFIGAPVHVEFKNLGTYSKAAYFPELTGEWALDFTLQGSDQVKEFTLEETLGDSDCTVIGAVISPISMRAVYRMPMVLEEIEAMDENGQSIVAHDYAEPPQLAGVRLKDGTMLRYITNGGAAGFEDTEEGIYVQTFMTDHIIDTDQVDALLFIKSYPEGDDELTEENLYIVPIK